MYGTGIGCGTFAMLCALIVGYLILSKISGPVMEFLGWLQDLVSTILGLLIPLLLVALLCWFVVWLFRKFEA